MENHSAFDWVEFSQNPPDRQALTGHDRFAKERLQGSLRLVLTAETPIFVSSGVTVLGSDVGLNVPLVRVMGQDEQGRLMIQGSSLKGCVRSIYEAITNSTVGVKSEGVRAEFAPIQAKRPNPNLSPAERVFGAMGFEGWVSFSDAVCDHAGEIGYLPPMHEPKRRKDGGIGRKFYFHQSVDRDAEALTAIQQAPIGSLFTATLRVKNLSIAEFGALLIALGQDPAYRLALKIGAGKGKGLGSATVSIADQTIVRGEALKARYSNYRAESAEHFKLEPAIAQAHKDLIDLESLVGVHRILGWGEERE